MTGTLKLPMRHKEGRIVVQDEKAASALHIPLQYLEDVNGAHSRAAGLLDASGQILGLMPHPEAALHSFLNPLAISTEAKEKNAMLVRTLFQNALQFQQAKGTLHT